MRRPGARPSPSSWTRQRVYSSRTCRRSRSSPAANRSPSTVSPTRRDAIRSVSPTIRVQIDRQKIRDAGGYIRDRVKGQDHAVVHTLDIIKRAITGVGASKPGVGPAESPAWRVRPGLVRPNWPRRSPACCSGRVRLHPLRYVGVLRRACGPTPDRRSTRLCGLRRRWGIDECCAEKPFGVILFDEIEKAHPRVLDKFLQVLDDGVLTSGRGDRVYYSGRSSSPRPTSESRIDASGNRVPNGSQVSQPKRLRRRSGEIHRHFKQRL